MSRRDIDPDALKILYRLIRSGHKAYLVGGGVRDLLLGKKPKDFDIATDATPRRVKALFSNSRIIGRRFKLVHIFFVNNKIVEVATFRDASEVTESEDTDSDGVTQQIVNDNRFGTEETDALRRDITINGLFYDVSSLSIIDYVGGVEDLKNRTVRMIGDPDVRLAEDPVRLLRVIRHAVRSSCKIEPELMASIERNNHLILQSAAVRVYEELRKDLSSGYSLGILRLLSTHGILSLLLPEITQSMLAEGSPFAESLGHIDDMIIGGVPCSTTLVFAVVALFAQRTQSSDKLHPDTSLATLSSDAPLSDSFIDDEDLRDHVQNFFSHLAVPRKEKERIEGLLLTWYEVVTKGVNDRFRLRSNLAGYLDEVAQLVKILPLSPHDRTVLRTIERIKSEGSGAGNRNRRRTGRPRRGRRRDNDSPKDNAEF